MKKNFLHTFIAVVASMFFSLNAMAQKIDMETGLVVWEGKEVSEVLTTENSNDNFIFLMEFKSTLNENDKEKYLSAGGSWGVQGVLSAVGMRLQIVQGATNGNNTGYQVVGRIDNSAASTRPWVGDRLGFDHYQSLNAKSIYLDRGKEYINGTEYEGYSRYNVPNWTFTLVNSTKYNIRYTTTETAHTVTIKTYRISAKVGNNTCYIATNTSGNLVTTTTLNQAALWVIVSEDDFEKAMQEVTWGEVDLGVFVQDAEFGRDNKDAYSWEWGEWNGTTWNKYPEGTSSTTLEENTQDDYWVITGDNKHWHQRNQNSMCNGVEFATGVSIKGEKVGTNIEKTNGNNVTANETYNQDQFQENFSKYYKAEIYNEQIALSQTLKGSEIPNLTEGLYKLTAQALYHDGENGTTNNGISYFVVKRVEYTDNTRTEVKNTSIERLAITPMNTSTTVSDIKTQSGVSAGYVMNTNADAYLLTFFLEITGTTDITIGIEQTKATGWTVIGNVHLFAHGKQALFIDEDWEDRLMNIPYWVIENSQEVQKWAQNINPYEYSRFNEKYEYPTTVYYNRTMTTGVWNTICLPVKLTGEQIRQTFGNDCIVSEFIGISKNQKSLLVFKPIDLNTEGMIAGKPYIIKPTKEPDYNPQEGDADYGKPYVVQVGNGGENHIVKLDAPLYFLKGVTKDSYYQSGTTGLKMPELQTPTDANPPAGEPSITFEGSYYRTGITQDQVLNGNKEYWMITKGNMYHLKGSAPGTLGVLFNGASGYNVWGTYCYLHADKVEGQAKTYNIGLINEDGDITAIDVVGLDVPGSKIIDNNSVYTLNGQKIGGQGNLNSLSKGIYIVNGKKYVVK